MRAARALAAVEREPGLRGAEPAEPSDEASGAAARVEVDPVAGPEAEALRQVRHPLVDQLVRGDLAEEPATVRVEHVQAAEPRRAAVGRAVVEQREPSTRVVNAHRAMR